MYYIYSIHMHVSHNTRRQASALLCLVGQQQAKMEHTQTDSSTTATTAAPVEKK